MLYRAGGTAVLCTASIDLAVPAWMAGKGRGWLTAEYQMHPRAGRDRREARDGRGKAPSGRTHEIQRLIGRALRAAVDLKAVGEKTIHIDCDVLEADGGTRTASVTAGFIALALAVARLQKRGDIVGPVLCDQVAAVSVGYLDTGLALDLVYAEDSGARVDMNVAATARGDLIEVQATAEGDAVPRRDVDRMLDLALAGIGSLVAVQRQTLAQAGVEFADLFVEGRWSSV